MGIALLLVLRGQPSRVGYSATAIFVSLLTFKALPLGTFTSKRSVGLRIRRRMFSQAA
jgi:hypothetical protein